MPVPVNGASVRALRHGRVVAVVRSRADGAFLLQLPAGTYALIAANSGGYPSTARALVTVRPGQRVSVTLTVDSGIR